MKKNLLSALVTVVAVVAMMTFVTACSDDDDDAPAGHTLVLNGVAHADPATVTCDVPECHGTDNAGAAGPACSECHME